MLPNALIIGAMRSGTTSVFYTLAEHPQVFCCPLKEPMFFARDDDGRLPVWFGNAVPRATPATLAEYERLFAGARPHHKAMIEASTRYLSASVAARIHGLLPDVRIIAILRHPVDQAWSIWRTQQKVLSRHPVECFRTALKEQVRPYPLSLHGQYSLHLDAYFSLFRRAQIHVTLFDDLVARPEAFFAALLEFLELAPHRLTPRKVNAAGRPRYPGLHRVFEQPSLKKLLRRWLPRPALWSLLATYHRARSANLRRDPQLSPELRAELTRKWYAPDIRRLAVMLDRELPWL